MTARKGLAVANPERRQCVGHRRDGSRCKNPPITDGTVCRMHGGAAPQVIAKARQRLLEAVDPMAARLVEIALHSKSESDSFKAITWTLERFGFDLKQQVEVSVQPLDEARTAMLDMLQNAMQRRASAVQVTETPTAEGDADIIDAEVVEPATPPGDPAPPRHSRDSLADADRLDT